MNLQGISEISFDETRCRSAMPSGDGPAVDEWLGHLVALVEAIYLRELRTHLDAMSPPAVASQIRLDRRLTVMPTDRIRVRGWSCEVDGRGAIFAVQVLREDSEPLCDGAMTLWTKAASATPIELRPGHAWPAPTLTA